MKRTIRARSKSSTTSPEATKATNPTNVLPRIQINDRLAIFGGTGSGKSILAQVYFRTLPKEWWGIIIDTSDSVIEPNALTFYNPADIPWGKAWKMRFVPEIGPNLENDINTLYYNIMDHGACWVWLDEANEITTAHHTAYGLRKALLQGRKAYVGHASCTPRPADITKSIVSQAQYIITFPLVDFDDRQRTARYMGMTLDELDLAFSELGEHDYLLYDIRERWLYIVPAVPKEIVEKILNPPEEEQEIEHPEASVV